MKKLKIGFVAGFMEGFSRVGLDLFAKYQKEMDQMSQEKGFEIFHYKKEALTLADAEKIRMDLDAKQIDFLLIFHPSYIIGDLIYELMKTRADVGLWAIEEPCEDGPMPLASFVNLSQNMSIAVHNFKGNKKKVKWFFGPIDGPFFKARFDITLKVLTAIKNLQGAKVAQIGRLADGHINHYSDVRDIYRHLGVDVSRDYEIEDIIAMAEEMPEKQVREELKKIEQATTRERIGESKIEDSVRMYLSIKKICEENNYSAVALSCWPKLIPLKAMTGCLINSMLNNAGIVAGCEADALSTVSQLLLRILSGQSVVTMDLPKFDISDNSLMLWHCGTSPFDMANEKGVKLERHYFADYVSDEKLKDMGPITDVVFKPSDVTAFRITGEAESFYYFTGKTFNQQKKSFNGSRGWVGDLKLFGESIKVVDLMNTLLVNGLPHHYGVVMSDLSAYLEEFAYWKDLKKVKKVEYKDYLYVSRP